MIGSGAVGIVAAALLAKAGMSVLVAEQGEGPGGYAHAFHHGPYVLDPAVHLVSDESLFDALLRYLDVRDRCTFLHTDRLFTAMFPGVTFHAPLASPEQFIAAHVEAFPAQAGEIRRFFALCAQIHREAHELPGQLSLDDLDRAVARFPTLFRYRRALLGDVMGEFISDPRARAVCGAGAAILGLPVSRLPFQAFAQLIFSYLVGGAFYTEGGAAAGTPGWRWRRPAGQPLPAPSRRGRAPAGRRGAPSRCC